MTNQWSGGFGANVSITNLGAPVSSWTLGFDFPAAGRSVTQGWNATWTQSGKSVTVASMTWNGTPSSTYGEGYKAHLLTQHP